MTETLVSPLQTHLRRLFTEHAQPLNEGGLPRVRPVAEAAIEVYCERVVLDPDCDAIKSHAFNEQRLEFIGYPPRRSAS